MCKLHVKKSVAEVAFLSYRPQWPHRCQEPPPGLMTGRGWARATGSPLGVPVRIVGSRVCGPARYPCQGRGFLGRSVQQELNRRIEVRSDKRRARAARSADSERITLILWIIPNQRLIGTSVSEVRARRSAQRAVCCIVL